MACASGSEPQPGAPAYVYVDPLDVQGMFTNPLKAVLLPAILALNVRHLEVAALCSLAQPTPGAFPATAFLNAMAAGPGLDVQDWQTVLAWLDTWIKAKLWSSYCQCKATPGACSGSFTNGAYHSYRPTAAVIGDTGLQLTITNVTATINGVDYSCSAGFAIYLDCYNASDTFIGATTLSPTYTHNTVQTKSMTPLAGTARAVVRAISGGGGAGCHYEFDLMSSSWTGTCAGSPTYEPAPTEPSPPAGTVAYPTAAVSAVADLGPWLDELRGKIDDVKGELRYLIGQTAPFAYVKGTPQAGLSGTGYMSVSEVCGVLVQLTTIPATKGRAVGTPDRYFDIGRVNWGTVDGYHAHVPIHESPQLVLGVPDTATRIGYTFAPGVVATLTPISRSA